MPATHAPAVLPPKLLGERGGILAVGWVASACFTFQVTLLG